MKNYDDLSDRELAHRIKRFDRLTSTHLGPSARRDELVLLEAEQRRRKAAKAAAAEAKAAQPGTPARAR